MALFDGLFRKLTYTQENVTKIGEAANEKGAGIELETDALEKWPGKISRIQTAKPVPKMVIFKQAPGIVFRAPVQTIPPTLTISKEV